MMNPGRHIVIRRYAPQDRQDVRRISYQTSFLGKANDLFDDHELVADALTLYFTEIEPQSCFVAVHDNRVIGYLIGAQDERRMNRTQWVKVYPRILAQVLHKGIFLHKKNLLFLNHVFLSFLKGEFLCPDFSIEYPAIFHINVDHGFRGDRVGERLVRGYFNFLTETRSPGVHVATMSERAAAFFVRMGLDVLFKTRRTYLKYHFGESCPFYLLGKKF